MTYRASQLPCTLTQCLNRSRLYPLMDPGAATVRLFSWLRAVDADGMPGYQRRDDR